MSTKYVFWNYDNQQYHVELSDDEESALYVFTESLDNEADIKDWCFIGTEDQIYQQLIPLLRGTKHEEESE